jgi:hypothetical protein
VIVAPQQIQLPTGTIATPAIDMAAVRAMIRRLYGDVDAAAKLESVIDDGVASARVAITMYACAAMALLTELRRLENAVETKGML